MDLNEQLGSFVPRTGFDTSGLKPWERDLFYLDWSGLGRADTEGYKLLRQALAARQKIQDDVESATRARPNSKGTKRLEDGIDECAMVAGKVKKFIDSYNPKKTRLNIVNVMTVHSALTRNIKRAQDILRLDTGSAPTRGRR